MNKLLFLSLLCLGSSQSPPLKQKVDRSSKNRSHSMNKAVLFDVEKQGCQMPALLLGPMSLS